MDYSWLMFDADGTLFDYDRAETAALEATISEVGLKFDDHVLLIYRQINGRMWQEFEQGSMSQERLKSERFRVLCTQLGVDLDYEYMSHRYQSNLALGTYLIDGADELLEELNGRYRIALITNGLKDVQRPRIAESTVRDRFSTIIISEEVGVAKPDSKIFDIAFQKMNHPQKDQVLIIGDSLSSDITGGINYGIDTCWYNPMGHEHPSGMDIRFEIRALNELLDFL